MISEDRVPLLRLILLAGSLIALGAGLTLPLFKFKFSKFLHSSLFLKIMFWIPIFVVFLAVLYLESAGRLIILSCLGAAAAYELSTVRAKASDNKLLLIYGLLFCLALAHFYLIGASYSSQFTNLLITICFASVLSDVAAFFCGNYLGRHKLPAWINKNKSWEGVAGQLLGALAGVFLVDWQVLPVVSLWVFLPLGAGSAIGDLGNSYVKRKLAVKDWSQAIPGHGGFTDRLSSLAGSAVAVFYFLMLTGLAK